MAPLPAGLLQGISGATPPVIPIKCLLSLPNRQAGARASVALLPGDLCGDSHRAVSLAIPRSRPGPVSSTPQLRP